MKKLLLTVLLLCAGVPAVILSSIPADATQSTPDKKNKTRLDLKPRYQRPHTPSRVFVECEYSAGVLYFTLPADVEYADIYIESAGAVVFSGDITADECALLVPGLAGEYTITCITDDGREFAGDITLN